jgi:transposase
VRTNPSDRGLADVVAIGSERPRDCEAKESEEKKVRPVREESFPAELVFQKNDFSYIDRIVDPDRETRSGPKGYPPSAMFMALLLMYLKEIKTIIGLVRFLRNNPEWLRTLGLRKRVKGVEVYSVPHRTRFYRFAARVGPEKMIEIFSRMVVDLMRAGIIKGRSVSLDATLISAWFRDCRVRKDEEHLKRCRHERSKDRDASWGYDHHRDLFIYGYKVHILLDSVTALPIMLTVTTAGYGENRTVVWFVSMILKLGIQHVRKFFADAGYDGNVTRLLIIEKLKAVPFIPLNPRNCKGATEALKKARRKLLCYRFYAKNFVKRFWVDPDSKRFDSEYDKRTFSEQWFSRGKGSINLDTLRHRGVEWATMHSVCVCFLMLAVAKTAVEMGRPDLIRCVKCFDG